VSEEKTEYRAYPPGQRDGREFFYAEVKMINFEARWVVTASEMKLLREFVSEMMLNSKAQDLTTVKK
jgi:hypothetical protein